MRASTRSYTRISASVFAAVALPTVASRAACILAGGLAARGWRAR